MIIEMSKGRQITIPAEMRDTFDLSPGTRIEIFARDDEIVLKPIGEKTLELLFEEAKHVKPRLNLTAEQMDELNEGMMR